jgi:L-ribulose-5-phosphate 3-epimerase
MATQSIEDRLAVCSWSLHPANPKELTDKMKQIGIDKMQLALDPLREGGAWKDAKRQLDDAGLKVIGGMFGSVGEDYSTLESIKKTGGVVPDETWPKTWANVQKIVPIAHDLGLKYVMFHAGFLPHDHKDPSFRKLLGRVEQVADAFGQAGITVGMETGQEDAQTLLGFFKQVSKKNVGINFDPANMILYDKGEPVESLRVLARHVKQCHIKDATKTKKPGTWGAEVVVGTGEVDWPAFFAVLEEAGFNGYLAIEREAGDQRVKDIRAAKEFVLRTMANV